MPVPGERHRQRATDADQEARGLNGESQVRNGLAGGGRRIGAGIPRAELERLWRRLQPLAVREMPLEVPPPRTTRFGSPLVLSRVHWVRPELVAEVKYLTRTGDVSAI
jgi:hypothetical protein